MNRHDALSNSLSARLFKAMADPKRLSLLIRLAEEHGPCTVSHLAEGSGIDLSVVSRHLAILREAGIIQCEKQGKEVWCTLQRAALAKFMRTAADALENCCTDTGDSLPQEVSGAKAAKRASAL